HIPRRHALGNSIAGGIARQRIVQVTLQSECIPNSYMRAHQGMLPSGFFRLLRRQPGNNLEMLVILEDCLVEQSASKLDIADFQTDRSKFALPCRMFREDGEIFDNP